PRAGRQHALGAVERVEQLVDAGEALLQPRVVLCLALQAGRVREQAADRRRVLRAFDMLVERVLEVETAFVAELHDRCRRERLRDRAEAVLGLRRRLALRLDSGRAERGFPGKLTVANDGDRDARQPLLALLG